MNFQTLKRECEKIREELNAEACLVCGLGGPPEPGERPHYQRLVAVEERADEEATRAAVAAATEEAERPCTACGRVPSVLVIVECVYTRKTDELPDEPAD
jgi:hypothetical protein